GRGGQPLYSAGPRVTTLTYADSAGNLVWRGEQPVDQSLPMRYTCFHYTPDGKLLEKILPEGNSQLFEYDGAGRVITTRQGARGTSPTDSWATACANNTSTWTGPLEIIGASEHGPGGFVRATTADGIRTQLVTDGFGRVIEEHDPLGQ